MAGASIALHLAFALLAVLVVRPAHVVEDAPPTVAMVFDAAPAPPAQAPVKADKAPDELPSAASPPAEPTMPPTSEPPAAETAVPLPNPAPASVPPSPEPARQPESARQAVATPPRVPAKGAPKPPAPPSRPAGRAVEQPSAPTLPTASPPAATAVAPASSPAAVNGAWRNALAAWVQSRKHYPDEACRQSREGQVAVRFTIARDGQVLDAQIVHGSGSDLLDQAALATFRDGRAPPFPADMSQPQLTTTVSIHYRLEE